MLYSLPSFAEPNRFQNAVFDNASEVYPAEEFIMNGTLDGATQLRFLLDDYFEMQLKEVVRLLCSRRGKQRYNGMNTQVIDLPQRPGSTQDKRVDETCWQILLSDDYFIDSTNHLLVVRKGGIGILMRIDWHHLSPTEVLDLFGKLRLMEYALQCS